MAVRPIPEGYHTVTPFIVAKGTAKLIDFMKQAFGAEEIERMAAPDGTVMHAELRIGDSIVMLGEGQGEWKPMPATLYLYVTDVDATFARALRAGATTMKAVADQFYGDRNGTVQDSWGNVWSIGTHIEDVSPDEMRRRAQAAAKQHG
jgi:PhnB protein